MIDQEKPMAFVMPHYSDQYSKLGYLKKTIKSIFNQTDPNWKLVIVDDDSTSIEAIEYLKDLQIQYPEKITVFYNEL